MSLISMGKEMTWKNTLTMALPASLILSLTKMGDVKQVTIRTRRGDSAYTESWNEHHFPYFDEIPEEVRNYLLFPIVLATAVFLASGLIGMTFTREERVKKIAPASVDAALKMFLAVIGFNGGQDLLGEGIEGQFLSAIFAGLGVVLGDFLIQQNGINRMRSFFNDLVEGKISSDEDSRSPASIAQEIQSYLVVFIVTILASICFSYSDEVSLDMFNSFIEGSTDHAIASAAVTGVLVGAILTSMFLFLPDKAETGFAAPTPTAADGPWVVVSRDSPVASMPSAHEGGLNRARSSSEAPYMPYATSQQGSSSSSVVSVTVFPSPYPAIPAEPPEILGTDPFATRVNILSPVARPTTFSYESSNPRVRHTAEDMIEGDDRDVTRIERDICPFS